MEVYVLVNYIYDTWYGESDYNIIGVFSTEEKARKEKVKLELEDKQWFEIVSWYKLYTFELR